MKGISLDGWFDGRDSDHSSHGNSGFEALGGTDRHTFSVDIVFVFPHLLE